MTYQGFHRRTTLVRWGLPAVAIGIVLGVTAPAAINGLGAVWDANRQSLPWLFDRVFAVMAYLAMTASVVYGLLLSTKLLDAIAHRPVSFALHQDLALVALALAAVHGALLAVDATMPFTLAQIVIPGQAPHAPLAVAAGQIGFWLMAVVVASFYVRRLIGQRAWRALHLVTFLAFIGATAHGIRAGSDTGSAWAQGMYLVAAAVVVFLTVYRIGAALAARPTADAQAAPLPTTSIQPWGGQPPVRPRSR